MSKLPAEYRTNLQTRSKSMIFDKNFFKYAQLIIAIIRAIGRIFGDKEDKKNDDEAQENHRHEIDFILKNAGKSD